MSKADYAALIALCAALASAIGDVIRQRSAQEITDKEVGHLELFGLSVRDPRWWLGGMGAIANYSLQAGALALGSVMLVTALQVTSLVFARLAGNLGGGGRRDGSDPGGVRAGCADLGRQHGRTGAAGGGGRLVAGAVRTADQGRHRCGVGGLRGIFSRA